MNILILNSTTTYNYGTFMLTANFIDYFEAHAAGMHNYHIYLSSDDDLPRLRDAVTVTDRVHKLPYDFNKTASPWAKVLQIVKDFRLGRQHMRQLKPTAVVVLGGDSLSEVYLGIKSAYYLYRFLDMSYKAPVFLLSQTIGPYYAWRKALAKRCFARCHVYARDRWTIGYLNKDIGVTPVHPACDLAFLDLKDQDRRTGTLNRYDLAPDSYITIVPSGLFKHYANTYDEYIDAWVAILNALFEMPPLSHRKIVLLAHVHDADRQDKRKLDKHVIRAIQDKLGAPCKDRLVTIIDEIMPSEARLILGHGVFTITARMHSAISTFQMLKPAIALSYSPKYKGVIGDELDRNDLVIESGDEDLWRSGRIASALEAKILYTLDNYDTLVQAIKARMPDIKTKALSQILHMVEVLDEHSQSNR